MILSQFENLLKMPESSILDFKRCQYDIINDSNDIKTAEFVKDIMSFSNTIRTDTAFIIIGVGFNKDGNKELIGLNNNIDGAIFQNKIKNKLLPIPYFSYYTIEYLNKTFGVIEIPIKKYPEPIFATIKMKGIEPGKVYFRRDSTNSEALGREVIMINRWLESLPEELQEKSLSDEISQTILKITSNKFSISECIAQTFLIAKKYALHNLKQFCSGELSGWKIDLNDPEAYKYLTYRMNKVVLSPYEIEINPFNNLSSNEVLNNLKKTQGFFERMLFFSQPISELEMILIRIKEKPDNTLVTLTSTAVDVTGDESLGNTPMTIYANKDNFENVYNSIKQKLINELLEVS